MKFWLMEWKIKEIIKRDKKIKNSFKHVKTVLDNTPKSKKYNFKKYLLSILILFISINSFLYYSLIK